MAPPQDTVRELVELAGYFPNPSPHDFSAHQGLAPKCVTPHISDPPWSRFSNGSRFRVPQAICQFQLSIGVATHLLAHTETSTDILHQDKRFLFSSLHFLSLVNLQAISQTWRTPSDVSIVMVGALAGAWPRGEALSTVLSVTAHRRRLYGLQNHHHLAGARTLRCQDLNPSPPRRSVD